MIHIDQSNHLNHQPDLNLIPWHINDRPPSPPHPASSLSPLSSPHPPPPPPPANLPQEEEEDSRPLREEEEEEGHPEANSRQSTPLSELTPAPEQDGPSDDGPEPVPTHEDTSKEKTETVPPSSAVPEPTPEKTGDSANSPPSTKDPAPEIPPNTDHLPSTPTRKSLPPSVLVSPPSEPPATPRSSSSSSRHVTPVPSSDSKVVTVLELNAELLKVSMDLQTRGIPMSESKFQQIAVRLQSNLAWLAAAADQSRQGSHSNMPLPIMDCPAPIDFISMERIQQLYSDLGSVFAKEIRRRQQIGLSPNSHVPSPLGSLKRDRPRDNVPDLSSKRRDTGESKSSSPASQSNFPLPGLNGNPANMLPPSQTPTRLPTGLVLNTAEAQAAATSRDRARQIQIRQAIQQQQHQHQLPPQLPQQPQGARQMSPTRPGSSQQHIPVQAQQNAVAGPSNVSNPNVANAPASLVPNATQYFQVLQNPTHPFMQYMVQMVPGFQSLPVQQQLQKMQAVQSALQNRSQQQQQQTPAQQRSQAPIGTPNSPFPMQGATPNSPARQQSPSIHAQSPQNPMFQNRENAVMDGRTGASNMANPSLPPGMNNLTPQQRSFLLQQQQIMNARGGGGGGVANPNPAAMGIVNPQQAFASQQQRMAAQISSNPNVAGDSFPTLRSNSTIPGIARSTRSPSDGTASPMTPRVMARATSSMQQEDYQRMIQAQQHQRMMMGQPSPTFNPQLQQQQQQQAQQQQQQQQQLQLQQSPQQASSNWQQSQLQQVMQMNHGQNPFGMSPTSNPGSAGVAFSGVPSPTGSQSWSQGPNGGQYPFSPSPSGSGQHLLYQLDNVQAPRQSSATPGPRPPSQQQQHQLQNNSPALDQSITGDFDIFNWTQQ